MSHLQAVNVRPTDDELEEFMQLKIVEKRVAIRLKEIKDLCEERGSFCSEKFACVVYEQEQARLAGLAEVAKALGKEVLEQNDLIKVVSFNIVKIAYRSND